MKFQVSAALLALPLCAAAVEPQPFDYWLLSLSWSPQYCAQGAPPGDPQCGSHRYGFVVHGLWPQNERGFPKNCPRPGRLPGDVIRRMLPLMPGPGLIQHEWNVHGACTGWPVNDYFEAVENAYRSINIPRSYQSVAIYLNTSAAELESQFMQANPAHSAASIALRCDGLYLQEVRLCLDKNFGARSCGAGVRHRCGGQVVLRPAK